MMIKKISILLLIFIINMVYISMVLLVYEYKNIELIIEQLVMKYGNQIEEIIRKDVNEFINNMTELNFFVVRGDKLDGC